MTVQETDLLFDGIPVRLYEPVGRSGDLAGIVYYHGGGWVFGSLGTASLTFCSLVLCCAHAVFQLLCSHWMADVYAKAVFAGECETWGLMTDISPISIRDGILSHTSLKPAKAIFFSEKWLINVYYCVCI